MGTSKPNILLSTAMICVVGAALLFTQTISYSAGKNYKKSAKKSAALRYKKKIYQNNLSRDYLEYRNRIVRYRGPKLGFPQITNLEHHGYHPTRRYMYSLALIRQLLPRSQFAQVYIRQISYRYMVPYIPHTLLIDMMDHLMPGNQREKSFYELFPLPEIRNVPKIAILRPRKKVKPLYPPYKGYQKPITEEEKSHNVEVETAPGDLDVTVEQEVY